MTPDNRIHILISVGSNVEREKHLPEAIRLMRRNRFIDVNEVVVFEVFRVKNEDFPVQIRNRH